MRKRKRVVLTKFGEKSEYVTNVGGGIIRLSYLERSLKKKLFLNLSIG